MLSLYLEVTKPKMSIFVAIANNSFEQQSLKVTICYVSSFVIQSRSIKCEREMLKALEHCNRTGVTQYFVATNIIVQ